MASVSRVFGLLAPILLLALGQWLHDEGILPIDTLQGTVIGIAAIGVVTGVLLRAWWSAVYAPGIVFGIGLIIILGGEVIGPDEPASAERTPLIVSLLLIAIATIPSLAVGAAIGTAIGTLVADRRPRALP